MTPFSLQELSLAQPLDTPICDFQVNPLPFDLRGKPLIPSYFFFPLGPEDEETEEKNDEAITTYFVPLHGLEHLLPCYNPPYFSPGPSPGPVAILLSADKPPMLKDQPPIIFPSATPPDLMSKRPLPMNPSPIEDLPPHVDTPRPMSTEPLPEPLVLEPPVKPLVPIPWNIYQCQYSSMEEFVKHVMQNPVSRPVDDLDSPMLDAPLLEPDPVTPYLPDSPEGHTHTLSPDKSPTEPWQRWLDCSDSPISRKHSLSPSSPSSAPIRQCTSWEGSYHSITPQTLLPAASIEASSEGNQSVLSLVLRLQEALIV